ncbi:hypothetical protein Tco_0539265 [Tanacetum coccineum]
MTEIFRLLNELTASRALKKVLIREEARHPITKNVNSISLVPAEEEDNAVNNGAIAESIMEHSKPKEEEPLKKVFMTNEVRRRKDGKPARSVKEIVTRNEEEDPVGVSSSHTVGIPEPQDMIQKGIKNDIEPIAPIMTVSRLVLEWEEKIKLHQEKEMKFNQWRSKIFKLPALVIMKSESEDEGEVNKSV